MNASTWLTIGETARQLRTTMHDVRQARISHELYAYWNKRAQRWLIAAWSIEAYEKRKAKLATNEAAAD